MPWTIRTYVLIYISLCWLSIEKRRIWRALVMPQHFQMDIKVNAEHTRDINGSNSLSSRALPHLYACKRERESVRERACIKDERSTFMTRPGVSLFNTFQTEFGRTTHTGRSSLATACAARCPSGLSTRRLAGATERIFWWSFAAAAAWSAFIYTMSNAAGDLRAALLLIEVSPCLTPRI